MNNFNDLKLELVKYLDEEDNKKLIAKEDYLSLLSRAQSQLGWRGCVFLFNSLISIFGLDKILQGTSNQLPECCLVSSKLPSNLNLDFVYSSSPYVSLAERKNFTVNGTSLKSLSLKEINSSLSHMFIDPLELDSLTINGSSISLHPILNSGEILYSIKTVYLNGNYPKDGNYVPVQIEPKSYSIPFRLEKIYFGKQFNTFLKSSFSECDRPLTIYVSAPAEVKFQKGAFNINVNHTIYVPKSAKVICAKEDSGYFRTHMKRY